MCWGETVGRKESSLVEYMLATAKGSLVWRASFQRLKLARAVVSTSAGDADLGARGVEPARTSACKPVLAQACAPQSSLAS